MKILIIDDSATFLRLVNGILTNEGYDVIEARDLEKAHAILDSETPDLIILDLFLSKEHGFSFLKKIKLHKIGKNVPVLVVSSSNKPAVIKEAMELGAADYLIKPINIQDLKNKCGLLFKSKTGIA